MSVAGVRVVEFGIYPTIVPLNAALWIMRQRRRHRLAEESLPVVDDCVLGDATSDTGAACLLWLSPAGRALVG